MKDSEKLINYLCEVMRGKPEYLFYKSSKNEIGIIQRPYDVRGKKSLLGIKVNEY